MTPDQLREFQIEAMRKLILSMYSETTVRRLCGFREAESLLNPELLLKDRNADDLREEDNG